MTDPENPDQQPPPPPYGQTPGFGQPPVYGKPGSGEPGAEPPPPGDPAYGAPGFGQPPPGDPAYGAPGYAVRQGGSGGVRIEDAPKDAQVFVDGNYAGIVDDYNGAFQSLDLAPGPHEIEVRAVAETFYGLSVYSWTDGRWLWAAGQTMLPKHP